MILDEIAYLVVTKATDQDYVSPFHSTEPSHLSLSRSFSYGSFTTHSADEHDRTQSLNYKVTPLVPLAL